MTTYPCKWCGTKTGVFVCDDCNKHSCGECKLASLESGCVHKERDTVTSQTWRQEAPDHHTCPSNIVWAEFYDSSILWHLVPRMWTEDKECTPELIASTLPAHIRSDGMIWSAYRLRTLCDQLVKKFDNGLFIAHIGADQPDCCPVCWKLRW